MSDSGFASLGPSLLARKGGAKPAMRPQVAPLVTSELAVPEDQLEDLGWNDMGDSGDDAGADIVPISADIAAAGFAADESPIVRRQQRRLEERVLADAAMIGPDDNEPDYEDEDESYSLYGEDDESEACGHEVAYDAPPVLAAVPQPEPVRAITAAKAPKKPRVPAMPAVQAARRAAFTLRLDADRHLKLRLAATMQGVSAQVLVTEALDRLLADYDDLDVIANHLKRH